MKIKFDPDLDFQHEAISSITGIFEGQETCQTNFSVVPLNYDPKMNLGLEKHYDLGIGNRLKLLDEDILKNVRDIQLRNGLAPSEALDSMNFTVEMETGTGKTYVYLRTIFELNRLYGFTKFIIVVPSVAIKEGVYKSLQMTKEHFRGLYENVSYDYFVYDSQKLGQVRNFATSDSIQIMVINIDAFRRSFTDPEKEDKANIIHRPHDRMNGSKPIDFIKDTNPIVIIDEPQTVDTTKKSKEAIASLNPLCTLRYSATHVDKYHMLYKLDSVDAYERKLVKQIEVAGIEVKDEHNKAYIKLLKVDNKKNGITAQIELDIKSGSNVNRKPATVRSGTDLLDVSGGRSLYDGYIIEDIYCEKGNEYISFTSKPEIVQLGQTIGDVNPDEYKRLQIRKTIEEHLEKELRLRSMGIKVLSLFFIDRVANYRWYDESGNPQKGKFAKIFEEEYLRAIGKPKFKHLLEGMEPETAVSAVHNGYFAIDKKKDSTGAEILKESSGEGKTQADESAYQLIMRDKEKLLSFSSKLKFIFSHSALKEGWDNPNVFQICTLNETSSVIKKRQEIGRGLRIAVNQDGERVHGFEVNTLTVMANESYESFAEQLQKEIEEEEGIKFGVVEKHLFANITVSTDDYTTSYLGTEASAHIYDYLKAKGYIDTRGKVQDFLKSDLKSGKIDLPAEFSEQEGQIMSLLKKVASKLNIKNKDNRETLKLNKAVFLGEDFKQLWERIKYRTTFRVDFDPEELIHKCAEEIRNSLVVGRARFTYRKAVAEINRGGIHAEEVMEREGVFESQDYELPDIITYLQNETNLTRRTLVEILKTCGRLEEFKNNPQKFVEQVSSIIKHQMRLFIVDGIKYEKIGDEYYYAQQLFADEEVKGYLGENLIESQKSIYNYVRFDSDIEAGFASRFELSDDVKVYAKLPTKWFKIDTPLGSYTPDWAVLVEIDGQEKLYFVVETKGSLFTDALRPTEQAKIECGRAHFKAMGNDVEFALANNYEAFSTELSKHGNPQ
ncbi:type III restriction-modification system endonuclease [Methanosarcina mazei]|jgi:type III restriction enzyme|uniref:Type III restriction endonuclease subunit R n=2 Tax=Methanosarcina mazei TaxID=2209 RepID=A0A0F8IHQ7_METMZ|nr:DEAD/DEAH box helicase family protein [Methanosarcina mazei]AKB69163.1 type III restriction-modification system StyLTI enzyme res [Methanosarcina mazei LYC]KKG89227.1 type III restriction endonuclease subunit R [Methanosarcina mazei]